MVNTGSLSLEQLENFVVWTTREQRAQSLHLGAARKQGKNGTSATLDANNKRICITDSNRFKLKWFNNASSTDVYRESVVRESNKASPLEGCCSPLQVEEGSRSCCWWLVVPHYSPGNSRRTDWRYFCSCVSLNCCLTGRLWQRNTAHVGYCTMQTPQNIWGFTFPAL